MIDARAGSTIPRSTTLSVSWWLAIAVVAVVAVVAASAIAFGRWTPLALPDVTGPFPVGTLILNLRAGTHGVSRSMPVQVWYPGVAGSRRALYGVGGPGLKRWFYHHVVTAHAGDRPDFAPLSRTVPVLVYVASWGGERTDNTALLEDLASHGYMVAAIGDSAFDDPPDVRLSAPADFGSAAAFDATKRLAHEKLIAGRERVERVLARLRQLNADDPDGRFTHRLDLDRIGVLGYSFGGAIAFAVGAHDPHVRAVLNMDGWLFDAAAGDRGRFSYLVMSDRAPLPSAADLVSQDPVVRYTSELTVADEVVQNAVIRRGGVALRFAGAQHLDFSDVPLYALRHRSRSGTADTASIARSVRAYARAFFDDNLRGTPSPLLTAGDQSDPDRTLTRSLPTEAP